MKSMNNLKAALKTVLVVGGLISAFAVNAADALSGTWSGTLISEKESFAAALSFSERGYWVYTYTNNNGVTRSVELEQAGQKIGYVPAGGGARENVVKFVEKRDSGYSIVLDQSFVKASNGHFTEWYSTLVLDVNLTAQGLETQLAEAEESGMSDAGSSFGNSLSTVGSSGTISTGVLQKVQ